MSVFDDEIYTISDDSNTEHAYVPKKGFLEKLKTDRKIIIFSGFPVLLIVVVVIILLNQQSTISQVVVTSRKSVHSNSSGSTHTSSNQNISNNQQLPTPTNNPIATSTNNPVQRLVSQVGTLLHLHQAVPSNKPNWIVYPPGTDIQAQNSQNQNSSQQGVSQTSQSSTNSEQNHIDPTPTAINNDIQLIFKDPDGTVEVYQPPPSPPSEIVWGRYVNTTDRYSIDYPTNWQLVKTYYNGHEGISLYLPGETIDQYAEFIGFGWATYYLLPEGVNITTAYTSPISVTGVTGTVYTQGALGYSYIASVFQYQNGYWGLGTSISDPTFAYVYDHMINSLLFNQ